MTEEKRWRLHHAAEWRKSRARGGSGGLISFEMEMGEKRKQYKQSAKRSDEREGEEERDTNGEDWTARTSCNQVQRRNAFQINPPVLMSLK